MSSRTSCSLDIVAVIHAIGLVARDLFCYLPGNSGSVHVACRCAAVVVHQFTRQPGFLPCGTPRSVVVLDALTLPVEYIGT